LRRKHSSWENRETAAIDLKRVELQKRIVDILGPRKLTPEQISRIAGRLTDLKGTKIDVFVPALSIPYDPTVVNDSLATGIAVVGALRAAQIDAGGWVVDSCQPVGGSNLIFEVRDDDPPSRKPTDSKIASRVRDAFKPAIGIWPRVEDSYVRSLACTTFSDLNGIGPNKRTYDAAISITIGIKINPELTLEMLESPEERKKP
jgi:hypothetical protein